MKKIVSKWQSWSPQLLSILRIVSALTFITFGTMKLFAFPIGMPEGFVLEAFSQIWWAGVLETFGGLLLLVGLFTRTTAFILSGEMAFAYFLGHSAISFWPVVNQGTAAILYCFIWLYISSVGAGPWSIDAMLKKRKITPVM